MNNKGGLQCVCGLHASDEQISQETEIKEIVGFDAYAFSVEVRKFHCSKCGYVSVSATVLNPYTPYEVVSE